MNPGSSPAPPRTIVTVPIGILCGCALVAIVLILNGSDVDETSGRLLGTVSALAVASLMASACLALVRRRPPLAAFGYVGILVAVVALALTVGLIWELGEDSGLARPAGVALVLAIASAHASLLLAYEREGESEAVRGVRLGTLGAMAILAALLCAEIVSPGEDVSWRAVGVFAVLYLLGTLLLPLMRVGTRSSQAVRLAVAETGATSATRLDETIEQLRGQGFELVSGPAPVQGAHGPAVGVALRDPDGRLLELTAY